MKIITTTMQKGGVLKSSTTAAFAYYRAINNKERVGVIDLDPQANITDFIGARAISGMPCSHQLPNFSKFLEEEINITEREPGTVSVMGGDLRLKELEKMPVNDVIEAIQDVKRELSGAFDLILIDTPPTVANQTLGALAISDFVMVPTNFDGFSQSGLNQVLNDMKSLRKKKVSKAKLLAVIPSLIDGNDKAQRERVTAFLGSELGGYLAPIQRLRTAVRQAINDNKLVWETDTRSEGKKEVLVLMKWLSEKIDQN